MYFKNLGYDIISNRIVALRVVRKFFAQHGDKLDMIVFEALKFVAESKSPVVGVKPSALLQIGASDHFRHGSDAYYGLLQLLSFHFADDKMYDNPPDYYVYRSDPLMSIDDLIEATTSEKISFISLNTHLLGDRTIWHSYCLEFIEWLHSVARIADDDKELLNNTARYRQHIVFKLAAGHELTPTEKTFICNYYPGSRNAPPSWSNFVSAQENSNPLVSRDFELVTSQGQSGPFSKYFKMISNQSLEQLNAIIIPGNVTLPVNIGSIIPRGCVSTFAMSPLSTLAYNEGLEKNGYDQRLRVVGMGQVPGALPPSGTKRDFVADNCAPALPIGVNALFPAFSGMRIPFDLPEVELTLRPPANGLDPNLQYAGLTGTWMSKWRGRKVSTVNGQTIDDLLTDIAMASATYGSGAPITATIPESAAIFSNEKSLADRLLSVGTLTTNAVAPIKFTFYIARQMKLETYEVDMRMHYARRGTSIILPAFVEFIHPPTSMLFTPAEAAISYVASQLGLTIEETKLNSDVITIAYNYAECELFFKGRTPPVRNGDLKGYISTMIGY